MNIDRVIFTKEKLSLYLIQLLSFFTLFIKYTYFCMQIKFSRDEIENTMKIYYLIMISMSS